VTASAPLKRGRSHQDRAGIGGAPAGHIPGHGQTELGGEFPAQFRAPAIARRWIIDVLHLVGQAAEDVAILITELISNCLIHAGLAPTETIVVQATRTDAGIRVEVCDEGGRLGKQSAHPDRTDGGRGLQIVEALSEDWGLHHDGLDRLVHLP
jgi:anti-sigma regulatory factor (Ser/Thr protein kinase)